MKTKRKIIKLFRFSSVVISWNWIVFRDCLGRCVVARWSSHCSVIIRYLSGIIRRCWWYRVRWLSSSVSDGGVTRNGIVRWWSCCGIGRWCRVATTRSGVNSLVDRCRILRWWWWSSRASVGRSSGLRVARRWLQVWSRHSHASSADAHQTISDGHQRYSNEVDCCTIDNNF